MVDPPDTGSHPLVGDTEGRDSWRVEALRHPVVEQLPIGARLVWAALLLRCHDDGWCVPSNRWLRQATGLGEDTVRRSLQALEDHGAIRRTARFTRRGRQTTSHVRINFSVKADALQSSPRTAVSLTTVMLEQHRLQREMEEKDRWTS